MQTPSPASNFLRIRLRAIRKKCGFTQEGVAELAGISPIYYQSIEAGRRPNVSLVMIEKIASAYGLKIHELFSPRIPAIKIHRKPSPPPHHASQSFFSGQ